MYNTCYLWELYHITKKETGFCRSYERDKAFCIIGGFEMALNLTPDKCSL